MGIAIGIFCIVAVLTFAGSMKRNVKQNLETLGLNVIFVEKWPWGFGAGEYKWWDFLNRPEAGLRDYKLLKQRYSPRIIREIAFQSSSSGITIKKDNTSTTKALGAEVPFRFATSQSAPFQKVLLSDAPCSQTCC